MRGAIVGYRYGEAESIVCPECIYPLFADIDVTTRTLQPTEELLDRRAAQLGIRRHDPDSFRSRDFPKSIYLEAASETDACVYCGQLLMDNQPE